MSPAARRRTAPAVPGGQATLDQMKAHTADAAQLMKALEFKYYSIGRRAE